MFALLLLAAAVAHAADSSARPARASARITAMAARGPVRVDGVLDDPAWRDAPVASGFVQAEPHEGAPASEATEVRVAYDADNLYIGAYLHDREPARIVVNDIHKDFEEGDQDDFEVVLDTFGDRRNGYVFITNAEGARADRQISNEGKEVNTSWDAVWTVKTRRVADGWIAEMAIPFRALRFVTAGTRPWGINFSRRIRRKNEVDFWSPVPRAYTLARVSLAGELDGLGSATAGRDLRIKPYVAGKTVRDVGGDAFRQHADIGVDVKYGVTSGLTLDATVNPDFGEAEADVQQVNLTQFSQFFPEKREFFLENSGIFYVGDAARNNRVSTVPTPDEDLLLFFSRRIGLTPDGEPIPIDGGARLTGHAGAWSIGALSMVTRRQDSVPGQYYGVFRARRNLFAGSDVGVLFMDRQRTDSSRDYNRVYGADLNVRFFGRLDWSSYVIGTSAPHDSSGRYAWRTSLNREGNFTHIKLGVMSIGEGFDDQLGYYRRVDVRKWFIETGLRPRPASLQAIGIREMHPHISWGYYQNQRGLLVEKNLHNGYTFFLNDGGYVELSYNAFFERITSPFEISSGIDVPSGGYDWHTWRLSGGTDPSRVLSVSFEGVTGGLWSGRQKTVNASVLLRPSYKLQLSAGVERTDAHLDLPAGAHFVETLWTFRGGWSFSTNMFLDALAQWDPGAHELNQNIRFNLIHHPLSDLYLVYNEQRFTTADAAVPGRSVLLKFTQMVAF